jgi:NhaA family Na+:H+ antiporter
MAQQNESDSFTFRELFVSDTLLGPMQRFLRLEISSSIMLILATVAALVWANSYYAESYYQFWHLPFTVCFSEHCHPHALVHWVNDGLMVLFFFVVGLEIKREILIGELSAVRVALLPVVAAFGGMVVPGLIYAAFNTGTDYISGWAIPMATDIAFVVGAVALLGRGLPPGLRIFLAAFAIADDIGAVLIIAVFYTSTISVTYLTVAGVILALMALVNALRIRSIPVYAGLGFALWVACFNSGVHPTVAGVAAAFTIPVRAKYDFEYFTRKVNNILCQTDEGKMNVCYWYSILLDQGFQNMVQRLSMACREVQTPLQRMEHSVHPWVAFLILPVFALANAGLSIKGLSPGEAFLHPVTLGICLGLFVGKPLGVTLFSYLAVKVGLVSLPENVEWKHMIGAGILGGIGFTMSLFVSGLSFEQPEILNYSKLGILVGSALAAAGGAVLLRLSIGGSRVARAGKEPAAAQAGSE